MKKILPLLLLVACGLQVRAQDDLNSVLEQNTTVSKDYVEATFKGLKIINAQTNETAKKHNLWFNISHRFGDVAGPGGGFHNFYGLDQAPDIRFAFDYGVTDRLQLGVGHSKGLEPYRELFDGNAKFKLLRQTADNKMPLAVTLYGVAAFSARKSSIDSTSDAYFQDNFSHRFSYVSQAIIARKFSPGLSIEVLPTWVHRNFVPYGESNDLFFAGAGIRAKFSRRCAFIIDYYHDFRNAKDTAGNRIYFDPLSVGVEIETGGHVFQLLFTNCTGVLENSYLPFTQSNWLDGQFRWGFNLTRDFVLGEKKHKG